MLLNIIRILLCQNWTRGEREYLDHQLEKGAKIVIIINKNETVYS